MNKVVQVIVLLILPILLYAAGDELTITIEKGEYWWGGLSSKGYETPYDVNTDVSYDLCGDNFGNQAQPLLLSSKGRYVWCENPISYAFKQGKIHVRCNRGEIQFGQAGKTLRDAYDHVSKHFFPPDGNLPAGELFTLPQYNTWIELMYDQNQEDILNYAHKIIENGLPPGVIMIDDNWQTDYGTWDFSAARFSDPKAMMDQLHEMGFKVMLWICPFVSADSEVYRYLDRQGMLILDGERSKDHSSAKDANNAGIIRWWNGASACLDLSNPATQDWFTDQLDYLVEEYGVDGFKFDAGDADFYRGNLVSYKNLTPNDHTTFFAKVGLDYPLNEYRASWKMAGLPLVQRLRDKGHNWEDLKKLIPDQMSQSLMGYAYTCPDMIGGGEFRSFLNASTIDQELIVRSAQVHALMPMMQFSVAPWRVLSQENANICREMAALHEEMGPMILSLAEKAAKTGEPIVKPLALAFPGEGYEQVKDQFMLGDDILVAPVLEPGARSRSVMLPKGKWRCDQGTILKGGRTIEIDVPLDRLPYFS